MPNFIAISNLDSKDSDQVQAREMNVSLHQGLPMRLSSGIRIVKVKLESRREALKQVVFQKALGSLYDKSARVAKLATHLADEFDQKTKDLPQRAAKPGKN